MLSRMENLLLNSIREMILDSSEIAAALIICGLAPIIVKSFIIVAGQLEQSAAAELEECPGEFHCENNYAPGSYQFPSLLS